VAVGWNVSESFRAPSLRVQIANLEAKLRESNKEIDRLREAHLRAIVEKQALNEKFLGLKFRLMKAIEEA
jgi:hypothetical protein